MDWIAGTSILLATLIVPFAIRRWIVRRPLSKTTAGLTAFGIWLGLFSFFWWAASLVDLQDWYSRKPHLGILAVAAVSYWMLTRPGRDVARRANDESSDDKTGLRIETRETPQQDSGRATEATRRSHAIQSSASANPNRVNWRRGLFRLWIFVSILWLTGAGSIAVLESSPRLPDFSQYSTPVTDAPEPRFGNKSTLVSEPPTIRYGENDTLAECLESNSNSAEAFLDCYDPSGLNPHEPTTRVEYVRDWNLPDLQVILLIIGAPVLLFALGAATNWILHGFGPLFGKNQATTSATNHQQSRWRRLFVVLILMVATMATTIAVYEIRNSYENCILRNMQGAPVNAVALIQRSCRRIAR